MTLKPCPFCGGKAEREKVLNLCYRIHCEKCGAATTPAKIVEDCEEAWNKRVDTSEEYDPFADLKKELCSELVKKQKIRVLAQAFINGVIDDLADLLGETKDGDPGDG